MIIALSTTNSLVLGLVALAWIVFSLVVSMVLPRTKPDFPGRHLPAFLGASALFFVAMLVTVFVFGKEAHETSAAPESPAQTQTGVTSTSTTAAPGGGAVDLAAGKKAWDKGSCGGCHVLKAAGGSGTVGPDLDTAKPDEGKVEHQVINGGGAMPAFKGVLSDAEIKAVSAYVAHVAGQSS